MLTGQVWDPQARGCISMMPRLSEDAFLDHLCLQMPRGAGLQERQSLLGPGPWFWSPLLEGLLKASCWKRRWADGMMLRVVRDLDFWLFLSPRQHGDPRSFFAVSRLNLRAKPVGQGPPRHLPLLTGNSLLLWV